MAYLVTFNVGSLDDRNCTNVHHAEMQAVCCGHPTDAANLRRLDASGWHICGPGWKPCPTPGILAPRRGSLEAAALGS